MELKEKIADYKRRAENKSLPASAVNVLNKKIEEMELELGKEPEKKQPVKAPKTKFKKGDSVTEVFPSGETKGEFTVKSSYWDPKTEQNRYNLHIKGSPSAVVDFSESQITRKASKKEMEKAFGKEFMKSKDKGAKKEYPSTDTAWVVFSPKGKPDSMQISEEKAKAYISRRPKFDQDKWKYEEMPEAKAKKLFHVSVAASKPNSECDEIIADAKAKAAKRKKSVQKPEIKKSEGNIDKVMDSLKHKFKDGDLTKDQIRTLLTTLRSQISELERLLKVA